MTSHIHTYHTRRRNDIHYFSYNTEGASKVIRHAIPNIINELTPLVREKLSTLTLKPSIGELLDPAKTALQTTVKDLQQTVACMQHTICKTNDEIQALRHEVSVLRAHQDDLEQHSRRSSVRVFGVPKNTRGSTDDKLLDICNNVMALKPPLSLNDIEVSRQMGKIESQTSQAVDGTVLVAKPRPIIVKFVSRRTKAQVMADRKKLRKLNPENHTPDCTLVKDNNGHIKKISCNEDLMKYSLR